jgi:hypothetical protein
MVQQQSVAEGTQQQCTHFFALPCPHHSALPWLPLHLPNLLLLLLQGW